MINFKGLPDEEKPRERLIKYNKEFLSNEELLAIILRTGTKKFSVKELACQVMANLSSIRELGNLSFAKLCEIEGIGKVKAVELLAAIELGRRVYQTVSFEDVVSCTNPGNIISYFNDLFLECKQEEFYVLYLDNKKKLIKKLLLFRGSINFSVAHPREVFKEAYLVSASYIICIHNHPSGDPTPSREDMEITRKIQEIGILHSILLVDHIIVGRNSYYSFFEDNKLR